MTHPFASLARHGTLVYELTRREILGRYRGASFGLLWSLISPFLMLVVYTVVFGYVLNNRWPGSHGGKAEFALILFVGLIVHGFFAECVTRAPHLILGNPNFVKRVVFPLDVLPWPMLGSALFHALINLPVLVLMQVLSGQTVPWTLLLFPLVMLPLAVMMAGVSWFLASVGAYFRDINQITGVIVTAFLFVSSAFVPVENLPPGYAMAFRLNPLTFFIDQGRRVCLRGELPDFAGLALYLLGALAVAVAGHAWFQKTRGGFADVL
jgi:lipopolysaccharide transport system permease protein